MTLAPNLTTKQVCGLLSIYNSKAYRTPHHRRDSGELYYSYHNISERILKNLVVRGFVKEPCGSLFELTDIGNEAAGYYLSVSEHKEYTK